MKKLIIAIAVVLLMVFATACTATPNTVTVDGGTTGDAAADAILAGADSQKAISLDSIKNIELYDLEGKLLLTFTADEVKDIATAYNNSIIDDTAYIEMITGNRMVINLNDDKAINLTSYGDETRVVAGGEDFSYHLVSPELAKILLEKR